MRLFFWSFLFLCLFTVIACKGTFLSNTPTSNQGKFIELLNEGYKIKTKKFGSMIIGLGLDRGNTCVYGKKINSIVKSRIDNFYTLIVNEFDELSMPLYVSSLNDCPQETSIFVFIHESLKNPRAELFKEDVKLNNFLGKKGVTKLHPYDGLANITNFGGGKKGYVSVKINQLSELINGNKVFTKVLKSTITEELYQAITTGRDVIKHKTSRASILHEPLRSDIGYPTPPDFSRSYIDDKKYITFYKKMLDAKPTGICSFDIWFLILADMAKDKKIASYTQYVELFYKNYDNIKKRAQAIEINPAYKNLFDSRCSGKNTGINTKIGIE